MAQAGEGKKPFWKRWWFIAIVLVVIVAVAASGGGEETTNTAGEGNSAKQEEAGGGGGGGDQKDAEAEEDDCGSEATDDCTPSVGPNDKVTVDALTWQVKNVETARSLGDQEIGLGEKADGTFVVVTLSVASSKDESATLTDEVVQLEGKGTSYSVDSEGSVAAIGAGEDPLFLEDLGPDQTTTSKVVFDVPPAVLKQKPKLRFNELGFGETHAFIELPAGVAR